ncbi:MAG: ABC transporter permease [Lactobacillus sp.]|jgi:putative ABC transport system permease protein|nr:ABC transporter permease [Lactobacillus sp.]MCI1481826.1 ABC transporter permease [Lactobacillus sp.]
MLWKLSLTGIKSRRRDYAVLFSGLMLAAAIFYMFMTLAINPAFLKGALTISFSITKYVFIVGIILLSIITLVYIVYDNSFLLSMRKKDYGLYLMLGARTSKIGELIFAETLLVGFLATILGSILGIGLAQLVSKLLINQLGLQIHKFVGFYLPALLWTIVFFLALFFLAALWNRHKLVKSQVIDLLHEQQRPVNLRFHPVWKTIEAVLGIVLLAVGYWAMWNYKQLMTNSLWIGLITIVAGTYFTFDSLFSIVIRLLRRNQKFANRRLHSFTLGQLQFRLGAYTRILSVVSLLFALALGAITVGLNFHSLTDQAMESTYYDVVIYKHSPKVDRQLKHVSVRKTQNLNYKLVGTGKRQIIYVSEPQIAKEKLKYQHFYQKDGQAAYSTRTITPENIRKADEGYMQLSMLMPYPSAQIKLVSAKQYQNIKAKEQKTDFLLVNNFRQNFNQIEKLQHLAVKQIMDGPKVESSDITINLNNSKSAQYRLVASVASGFEFMGFFLGLAFLAMLASTLMFKALSGAESDKLRYQMLAKIGAQVSWLKQAVRVEIGTLFALPAVLGIVDVLFGLQFFKSMLKNPYDRLWIPFTLFLVIYLLYYLLTVKMYEQLVLKNQH